MNADKVVEKLIAQGYAAYKENNMVMIKNDDPKVTVDFLKGVLESMEYQNSFGMKLVGEAKLDYMKKNGIKDEPAKKNVVEEEEDVEEVDEPTFDDNSLFDDDMSYTLSEDDNGQMTLF